MKRFVLIDGHSLLFRAYHALPKTFTNKDGQPVNAVYGFMSMLTRVVTDLKPDFLAVAFDEKGPTLRHAELVTYKEGRPEMDDELREQLPMVREMLQSFGVPVSSVEGYEGEDIIATAVAKIKNQSSKIKDKEEMEFYIVSGDRDVIQLINKEVKVYSPKKSLSEPVIYDENNAQEVFGVEPSQIPDYKGLRGDPSDRIPGVFGIGEKTAVSLIGEFGSVENLYQHIGEVRSKFGEKVEKKLAEGAEQAVLSKKLATITDNAPVGIDLDECRYVNFETNDKGLKYLSSLGFKSLIKRLTGSEELNKPAGKRIKAASLPDHNQMALLEG